MLSHILRTILVYVGVYIGQDWGYTDAALTDKKVFAGNWGQATVPCDDSLVNGDLVTLSATEQKFVAGTTSNAKGHLISSVNNGYALVVLYGFMRDSSGDGGDLTELEAKVSALETAVSALESLTEGHTTDISSNESGIDALETLTSGHTTDISNNSSGISTNDSEIQSLDTRVTALENA